MDNNSTTIEFLAIIDDTSSALKISGAGNGGKLTLAFSDTEIPQVLKAVLLRERLLVVRIEAEE